MNFILSDNGNYDFNVKVGCCEFVGFVNDVIVCVCLGCVFCLKIKKKEKDTFDINFYYIIFLQGFFFYFLNFSFFQLNNYKEYV